ncbi:hypothetical protein VTN77DRAFT_3405 [Rasamsonia byssochlamydoides]|uniref:uncharacterized protein n=1 Tax=Rasamsonia byssochlamydoides TaxID=89139 RepID=UPI003744AA2E
MSDSTRQDKKKEPEKSAIIRSAPSREDVLNSHNYKPDVVKEFCDNLTNVSSGQEDIDRRVKERVLSLTNRDEIQSWLQDPESNILVLSGGSDHNLNSPKGKIPYENGYFPPVSGASFVSAQLVRPLLEKASSDNDNNNNNNNSGIIPLVFFCTLQRRSWKGILTPKAFTMNLMMQLIDQHRYFDNAKWKDCIIRERTDLEVWARLTELVFAMRPKDKQTPTPTLFLVIDGCHDLLREQADGQLSQVWDRFFIHLTTLVHFESLGRPTVKVLFAGPGAKRFHGFFQRAKTRFVDLKEADLKEIEAAWAGLVK